MDRSGSAKGKQSELTRVTAAFGSDRAQHSGHGRICYLSYTVGDLQHIQPEWRRQLLLNRVCGSFAMNFERRPCDRTGVHIAEYDVCVGDCRLGAAVSIAYRTGFSARTARADAQSATVIEPGDTAAA